MGNKKLVYGAMIGGTVVFTVIMMILSKFLGDKPNTVISTICFILFPLSVIGGIILFISWLINKIKRNVTPVLSIIFLGCILLTFSTLFISATSYGYTEEGMASAKARKAQEEEKQKVDEAAEQEKQEQEDLEKKALTEQEEKTAKAIEEMKKYSEEKALAEATENDEEAIARTIPVEEPQAADSQAQPEPEPEKTIPEPVTEEPVIEENTAVTAVLTENTPEEVTKEPTGGGTGNANNFDTYDIPEQQQTADTWVLNISSMKIHHPDCKDVKKIKSENYSTSNASLNELLTQGYTTCGHCFK